MPSSRRSHRQICSLAHSSWREARLLAQPLGVSIAQARRSFKFEQLPGRASHIYFIEDGGEDHRVRVFAISRRTGAHGHNQWAFRKAHSCKDLVTAKLASWIWAAQRKCKTAVYLSDISGAFDRVDRDVLVAKCRRAGLGTMICRFAEIFMPCMARIVQSWTLQQYVLMAD